MNHIKHIITQLLKFKDESDGKYNYFKKENPNNVSSISEGGASKAYERVIKLLHNDLVIFNSKEWQLIKENNFPPDGLEVLVATKEGTKRIAIYYKEWQGWTVNNVLFPLKYFVAWQFLPDYIHQE